MSTRGRQSASSLTVVKFAPLRKPPEPPAGLGAAAAELWTSIVRSLPADFFRPADLPLLEAYCVAADRKRQIDGHVSRDGLILDALPHPGLRMSRDEAGIMATLAVKLRLCPSSRTRPESASLRETHAGPRPWDKAEP